MVIQLEAKGWGEREDIDQRGQNFSEISKFWISNVQHGGNS